MTQFAILAGARLAACVPTKRGTTQQNQHMKTVIYKTKSEFDARKNKALNGVSPEFAQLNPDER